ncbi:CHC2 zinc finger domain-containing protein [Larkinella sp. GY13]|uniref:CHC2 zinc finger domain-containing protein n=1 Tax=Larkinella sp. GY13 TaxID=3453720 RepID=UPI003EF02345
MMTSQSSKQLKQRPNLIVEYLGSIGIEPEKTSGNQLVYLSPLTGEKTPSFYVRPQTNQFNCFSSGEKGDVIRLVRLLEGIDFINAVDRLASLVANQNPSFSFSGKTFLEPKKEKIENCLQLNTVKELQSLALISYVESRGIPLSFAKIYAKEVHYTNGNRNYYSIGFRSDNGSYALRSAGFKSWIGHSGITTIPSSDNATVNVFEGFFDFLSALVYFDVLQPRNTTIILNSTTNLKQALPYLQKANLVNAYLDNDPSGKNALAQLHSKGVKVKDRSELYEGYKDLNEMLIKHMIQKPDT